MTIDTGILIVVLAFLVAGYFSMKEWKGEVNEWKKGVGKWQDGVDRWKDGIDTTITGILNRINIIDFKFDLAISDQKVTIPGSPIELSEYGEEVSEGIGGKAWAQEEMGKHVAGLREKGACPENCVSGFHVSMGTLSP